MNEQQFGLAVVGRELSDDVGASRAPFGKVSEDLLVEKLDVPEIEPLLDVREKRVSETPAGTSAEIP